MPMLNYRCIKCGSSTSSSSHPLVGKCVKGKGHEWVVEDGKTKNYRCIKCGNSTSSSSHPLVGKCVKGGEHQWIIS